MFNLSRPLSFLCPLRFSLRLDMFPRTILKSCQTFSFLLLPLLLLHLLFPKNFVFLLSIKLLPRFLQVSRLAARNSHPADIS